MGEMRDAYKILVGRPEEKSPLGRHRHRWKNNINIDFRKIVLDVMNFIHLAQDGGLL
jgi:hypothetical protein